MGTPAAEESAIRNPQSAIRCLRDRPLDGPTNMARDEALLETVGAGEGPPTLRLYEWSAPTISLGRFQSYADVEALAPPAGDLPVVRRLTGGGAILHDRELTCALVVPVDDPLVADHAARLYERVHDAVIAVAADVGLAAWRGEHDAEANSRRGPFFCFARRHRFDVIALDGKLAGSAQRRGRRAVLQHGSIILARRFDQQPSATLEPMTADELCDRLATKLGEITGRPVVAGNWFPDELVRADSLRDKYLDSAWTQRQP